MAAKTTFCSVISAWACCSLPLLAQPLPPAPLPGEESADSRSKPAEVGRVENGASSTGAGLDAEVPPGALRDERLALLKKIYLAKARGCGIGGYMSAFTQLQNDAKGGESEESLRRRMGAISTALDEQIERSRTLKTQQLPPGHKGTSVSSGASGGNLPRGIDADLLKKYGDKLPADVNKDALMKRINEGGGGQNADDLIKKFSSDPRAREVLEKLKATH